MRDDDDHLRRVGVVLLLLGAAFIGFYLNPGGAVGGSLFAVGGIVLGSILCVAGILLAMRGRGLPH